MTNLERENDGLGQGRTNRGWRMTGKGALAGIAALAMTAMVVGAGRPAAAQNKDLSDKSVSVLMQYAWVMTPAKFTTPKGKVIEVDKNKPKDVMVPIDTAREVVKVARLTAYAQLCQLPEEQASNYQTMMRRERAKDKWSDQQILYINQLHLFTVMTLTGKVTIVEKNGDKQVVLENSKPIKTETCTETERKRIRAEIATYVNAAAPAAGGKGAPAAAAK
jgi:hypothetical protein